MSKKITLKDLNSIKILFKEDAILVHSVQNESIFTPLTASINHYSQGTIILLCPEKLKTIKPDEAMPNDEYKLHIQDKILFESGSAIPVIIGDNKNEYFLIQKKDIILIYKN
jgi:co-chaperonin GroES (HSP10)